MASASPPDRVTVSPDGRTITVRSERITGKKSPAWTGALVLEDVTVDDPGGIVAPGTVAGRVAAGPRSRLTASQTNTTLTIVNANRTATTGCQDLPATLFGMGEASRMSASHWGQRAAHSDTVSPHSEQRTTNRRYDPRAARSVRRPATTESLGSKPFGCWRALCRAVRHRRGNQPETLNVTAYKRLTLYPAAVASRLDRALAVGTSAKPTMRPRRPTPHPRRTGSPA